MIETYKGDKNLERLILEYAIPKSLPEIRALIMSAIWSVDLVPPSHIQELILEEHAGFEVIDHAREFLGQCMALWNQLAEHQNEDNPFKLYKVKLPKNNDELINLLAIRRSELESFDELLADDTEGEYIDSEEDPVFSANQAIFFYINALNEFVANICLKKENDFKLISKIVKSVESSIEESLNEVGKLNCELRFPLPLTEKTPRFPQQLNTIQKRLGVTKHVHVGQAKNLKSAVHHRPAIT